MKCYSLLTKEELAFLCEFFRNVKFSLLSTKDATKPYIDRQPEDFRCVRDYIVNGALQSYRTHIAKKGTLSQLDEEMFEIIDSILLKMNPVTVDAELVETPVTPPKPVAKKPKPKKKRKNEKAKKDTASEDSSELSL